MQINELNAIKRWARQANASANILRPLIPKLRISLGSILSTVQL